MKCGFASILNFFRIVSWAGVRWLSSPQDVVFALTVCRKESLMTLEEVPAGMKSLYESMTTSSDSVFSDFIYFGEKGPSEVRRHVVGKGISFFKKQRKFSAVIHRYGTMRRVAPLSHPVGLPIEINYWEDSTQIPSTWVAAMRRPRMSNHHHTGCDSWFISASAGDTWPRKT